MDANLQDLFATALATGLDRYKVNEVSRVGQKVKLKLLKKPVDYRYVSFIIGLVAVLYVVGLPLYAYRGPLRYFQETFEVNVYNPESKCLLSQNEYTMDITRPLAKCSICEGLTEVPVVHNITKEYFIANHAYSGVPVLIKNGTGNWTAHRYFGWRYFRKLYSKLKAFDEFEERQCQFFPYKTNFRTLKQVFQMSKGRAEFKKDQWYVGWSNCIPKVQKILRKHYQRPEFLPDDSESSSLDWIFMGGSGYGAQMHIDSVNRPSWQAMVKGKKTWFFEPPPECEHVCKKNLSATMEIGDVLVVDTNQWFHSTYIYPGELSITIGSEYD